MPRRCQQSHTPFNVCHAAVSLFGSVFVRVADPRRQRTNPFVSLVFGARRKEIRPAFLLRRRFSVKFKAKWLQKYNQKATN